MTSIASARDRILMRTHSHGQDWDVSWHPPSDSPTGRPHGAAGVCVTPTGGLVLISHDGQQWGFPAGRPEPGETIEETLRREMREEACVTVTDQRLLGFARSLCVAGHEKGLVLVRSYWAATVEPQPWEPEFEILHRRVVPVTEAKAHVRDPDEAATQISFRALDEAGFG